MNQKRVKKNNPKLMKVNLLALVLSFEKYWQSYSLSDGVLYSKEVRAEAKKIVPLFYEIFGKKIIVNPDRTVNDVDIFETRRFIEELDKWLDTEDKFPKVLFGREYTSSSQFIFSYVFIELESHLQREIGLPVGLSYTATAHESYFRRKQLKWAGQLPDDLVEKAIDSSFIMQMSKADTLVMVADIRRSQDLITYGLSPEFYREQIIGFLAEIRKILRDDYGIYDRFPS